MSRESRWGSPLAQIARSQWPVSVRKCETGQRLTLSGPWHSPVPLPRFPVRRRPRARQRLAQLSGICFRLPASNQEPPTRCCDTSELSLSRAKQSRRAGALGRVATSLSLEEGNLPRYLRQSAEPQTALRLQALGRWVPWIAELAKRVKRARKAKEPTPTSQFGPPPPLGAFLPLLSPATCRFPAHPATSLSPEHREKESQEPAGWFLRAVATLSWGKPRCLALPRLLPNGKCVGVLSGFSRFRSL